MVFRYNEAGSMLEANQQRHQRRRTLKDAFEFKTMLDRAFQNLCLEKLSDFDAFSTTSSQHAESPLDHALDKDCSAYISMQSTPPSERSEESQNINYRMRNVPYMLQLSDRLGLLGLGVSCNDELGNLENSDYRNPSNTTDKIVKAPIISKECIMPSNELSKASNSELTLQNVIISDSIVSQKPTDERIMDKVSSVHSNLVTNAHSKPIEVINDTTCTVSHSLIACCEIVKPNEPIYDTVEDSCCRNDSLQKTSLPIQSINYNVSSVPASSSSEILLKPLSVRTKILSHLPPFSTPST